MGIEDLKGRKCRSYREPLSQGGTAIGHCKCGAMVKYGQELCGECVTINLNGGSKMTLTRIINNWSVVGEDSSNKIHELAMLIGKAKSIVRSVDLAKMSKEDAYTDLIELMGVDR